MTPTIRGLLALQASKGQCDGVWHVTSPREPACPKCGETGPQTLTERPERPAYRPKQRAA